MFLRDPSHTGFNPEETILQPPLNLRWTFGPTMGMSSAAVVGKTVFVRGGTPPILYALDADTGNVKWSRQTAAASHTSPAVDNNTIFIGNPCTNCSFEAIDANTGSLKWSITLAQGARDATTVDGIVYFGSDDHYVRAAEISTGNLLWTSPDLGDGVTAVPAVANGKVFVGTWSGNIYALDSNTGIILWQFPAGGVIFSSPSVIGNTVYVGSGTQNIYAINAEAGSQKWKFCCAEDSVWGSPAVAEGILYVQDLVGKVHALDINTGTLLWSYKTGAAPSSSFSSAAIANGVVYIGSQDEFVYAFNAKSGNLLWKFQTGGPVLTSPAVANDMVYIGSQDGKLYAFGAGIPFPSPTPIPTTKVVVAPGLGGSWNADAILNCKLDGYSGDWTLTPLFADTYNPLLSALGDKAKPFYYDWRKDVRDQRGNLQNFINGLLSENEKVHLVGHSLGGLVGRAYLENQTTNSRLDKLLTIGSPHQGAPVSYAAWSGGEIWQDNLLHKIILTILLRRCRGWRETSRETIQRVAPSIENLLPVFDYLKDKTSGLLKPVASMRAKNNWLPTNFAPPFWGVTLGTLSGNGFPTLKVIPVKDRNRLDARLGNWADGKPVGKEFTNEGDGTVLNLSSQLAGADNRLINQNHGGLVASSEGIGQILDFLGISATTTTQGTFSEPKSALLIMGYPANFWVMDQNGKIIKDKEGMVSLINPPANKYKFGLIPKSGNTLFIVAQFLEDGKVFWKEYNFKYFLPKLGEINFNPANPAEDPLR